MQHDYPFDPTYGYSQNDLLAVGCPPEPGGFAEFWQNTYTETLSAPLNLSTTLLPNVSPSWQLFQLAFDTFGGIRIGAWLLVPADGDVVGGAVVGHGYGGRDAPELTVPFSRRVIIFPCAPGFNLSAREDIPGKQCGARRLWDHFAGKLYPAPFNSSTLVCRLSPAGTLSAGAW